VFIYVKGGDSSDDCIFVSKKKCVGSKTSDHQKTSDALWNSTRVNHMNSEQKITQDFDAQAEGVKGEAKEVAIYASYDKISNGKNVVECSFITSLQMLFMTCVFSSDLPIKNFIYKNCTCNQFESEVPGKIRVFRPRRDKIN